MRPQGLRCVPQVFRSGLEGVVAAVDAVSGTQGQESSGAPVEGGASVRLRAKLVLSVVFGSILFS